MKKILRIIFISLLVFSSALQAQVCDGVSAEAVPLSPQTGSYNYFGVRVTLSQTYDQDVTVTGYIFAESSPNQNKPYTLTVTSGNLTAETDLYFFQTGPADGAGVEISSVTPCPSNNSIIVTYAGVSITYETNNNILKFNSTNDVYIVLDQLDDDYNDNYDNYDSQIDTSLAVSVLDSLDEVNGFDSRISFKNFENLFSGYNSIRMAIESTEIVWLDNDFTGTNPSDIDLTFDDALNTICNNDYSFKVGNDIYSLTSSGLYINGTLQEDGGSMARIEAELMEKFDIIKPIAYLGVDNVNITNLKINQIFLTKYSEIDDNYDFYYTVCKSNKKKVASAYYNNDTERYELEVAINSIGFRSGVHGKVIHFKKKNNKWKRSRAQMTVGVGGAVYSVNCNGLANINETNPYSGYKKREELKAMRHSAYGDYYKVWKTYTSQLGASFTTPYSGQSGVLTLTF